MGDDFLKELGYLALASRLKRISDKMIHSGRVMYKALDIDIEPNWYLIFNLLKKHHQLSIMEIASQLQFSHPSVITIVNKMTKNGYLTSINCKDDGRKQYLQLTQKAIETLPQLEKIWQAGTSGVAKMAGDFDILAMLDHLENQLDKQSFMERTIVELNQESHAK